MSSTEFTKIDNALIDFDENGCIIIKKQEEPPAKRQFTDVSNIITNQEDGPGPYECTICYKKFVKKSYWKRHVLSHNEMFACKVCGKQFMHQTHVNQHMNVHKEEKEHACDICGYKVRFKFNLSKHRATHIPYKDHNGEIKYLTLK